MRRIWAIRHCEPVKGNTRICLGQKGDPPLSPEGLAHAQAVAERFAERPVEAVYCSPLLRGRQTAACFGEYRVAEGLIEQDMGVWDGLDWTSIKERFADLHEARGRDNSLTPAQAETFNEVADRYEQALLATQGNCIAVVHNGAMSALLCCLLGTDPARLWKLGIPYGGCVLLTERDGHLDALPSDEDADRLFRLCGTPDQVIAHCRAVAGLAREIAEKLVEHGERLSLRLVYAAALLHDIARTQKDHPACGAQILAQEGYPHLGRIVAKHHDANQQTQPLDEAAVAFFADKLVSGTERVDLHERFARSAQKCTTDEARAKHAALLAATERIHDEIARITATRY